MAIQFDPMRSLLYVDCVNEKYRVQMEHWLHTVHVPESISQFEPYVTKYAFYKALPTPAEGARFGVVNCQLTEHYWLFNPNQPECQVKAFQETIDVDALKGAGILPDDDMLTNETFAAMMTNADALRNNAAGAAPVSPFVFVFVPVFWQEDYKGSFRTITQGPNYRWQFLISYPEGCSETEGDRWFREEVIPVFQNAPEVRRILSSKVRKDANGASFDRVCEIWFANEEDWHKVAVEGTRELTKPAWATADTFPFLQPKRQIVSIMLGDYASSDNLSSYRGAITMR